MSEPLNGKEVKEKIKNYLDTIGPSLPIQVAKQVGINSLFASAFLSEMAAEKTIKISHMKVGGSPLYYTPQKESSLENFYNYLGNKEKEAFLMLKEKGILEDEKQNPAIRVALRNLKDFAFAYKEGEKIFWKYFNVKEPSKQQENQSSQIPEQGLIKEVLREKIEIPLIPDKEIESLKKELEEKKGELEKIKQEMQREVRQVVEEQVRLTRAKKGKKQPKPIDESFLNQVKEFIKNKGIELMSIESFDRKEVFLKVKKEDEILLLASFNKKKIDESDLSKAYRKAAPLNLDYIILFKGELSKKMKESIKLYNSMKTISSLV